MSISKERLAEIAAIPDEEIDLSDIPELDASFFENARILFPGSRRKEVVTMPFDADILEWFRSGNDDHLAHMNAVLRAYMLSRRTEN